MRRLENSRALGDQNGLPGQWNGFSEYDFQLVVRNLDKYNHGVVNWKQLATFICLLQSSIATEADAENIYHQVSHLKHKDGFVDENSFI